MFVQPTISKGSWVAFYVSAALLLIFAVTSLQQLRLRLTGAESEKASAVQSQAHKAQDVTNQGKDVAPEVWEGPPKNEPAPDSAVKELVQAWNKGDPERIAALFVPDGILRIPSGSEIKSREEIRNTIAKHQNGMLSQTTLTNTIDGITKSDEDTVVVKGTYQLDGIKVLGFNTNSKGTYEIRETKRDGRWLIAQAEVTRD